MKDSISNLDVSCGSGDTRNVINDEPDEKLAEEESDIDGAEEKEENGDPDGDKVEPELEGRKRKITTKPVKSEAPKEISKWKETKVSSNDLMLTIHKRLNERSENKSKIAEDNDAEAIFGKMVADELR